MSISKQHARSKLAKAQEEWALQGRAYTEQKEQKRILLKETEKALNKMGFEGKVVQLGPELSKIWDLEKVASEAPRNLSVTGGETLECLVRFLIPVQEGRVHKDRSKVRFFLPFFRNHMKMLERICSPE